MPNPNYTNPNYYPKAIEILRKLTAEDYKIVCYELASQYPDKLIAICKAYTLGTTKSKLPPTEIQEMVGRVRERCPRKTRADAVEAYHELTGESYARATRWVEQYMPEEYDNGNC